MDTMKLVNDIADSAEKYLGNSELKMSPKSISSYASKAIYYFPVLCSKSIIEKNAFMIASNLEASYSSFVAACFSMVPAIVVKGNSVNVEDYLKIFHQNVGINSGNEYYVGHESAMLPYEMFVNGTLNEATGDRIKHAAKEIYNNEKGKEIDQNLSSINSKVHSNFTIKEVEKKNNLKPSIVQVTCTFLINQNEVKVNIPVGVKTVLHPVNSNELANHVADSMANKGLLHSLIKYTTGEVMSLSDMIFGISKIKSTAVHKNTELGKWVDAIEHRKRLNRLSRGFLQKKPYLPNISMIISMSDVDDIEHMIGYNLLKDTHRAVKFMRDNFLLTLVIADDATETAYVMYDGHSSFEDLPYSSMRRENERTVNAMEAMSRSLGIR